LDYVIPSIEEDFGQRASTLQILHKVEALKVCVDIDSHSLAHQPSFSTYELLFQKPSVRAELSAMAIAAILPNSGPRSLVQITKE